MKYNSNYSDYINNKFYKTYHLIYSKKNKVFNFDNSLDINKTFFNTNISNIFTKSNSNKILNLKTLSIITDKKKRKNKFFNNNLLSNHLNSFNKDFKSVNFKLNQFINKRNDNYKKEHKNSITSLEENKEKEKELKQFSLTVDKNINPKYYSIREFKNGYIISRYYSKEKGKFENIKTNSDSTNSIKHQRTPKFSNFLLNPIPKD